MKKSLRWVTCVVLMVMLAASLSPKAEGQSSQSGNLDFTADKALLIVGIVAVGVIVTLVVLRHKAGNRTITGCVNTGPDGLTMLSERDKQLYALSGATDGIKPGERMTLQIRKLKPKGAGGLQVWKPRRIVADAGPCQP